MPTNRVTKGDSLKGLVLQPGWSIENDGYGLITARATYIQSHGNDAGTTAGTGSQALAFAPRRGDVFPKDGRCYCVRSSSAANSNGLLVVTAEYCGISTGNMTTPEVSGRGATTTEPIATHPVFKSLIGGTKSDPKNGAEFNDDGSFNAFNSQEGVNIKKYGVRSYYAPTFSINGHFYTSDITVAKTLMDSQCTSSSTGAWKNIQLVGKLNAISGDPGSWVGMQWSAADESPQLLLVGVSIEDYGKLFKVGYDILVSYDGWDTEIYPWNTAGRPKRDDK